MSRNLGSYGCLISTLLTAILLIVECKVVKHVFTIGYLEGSPDGVRVKHILGINNRFPGPTIRAVVGDTIQVRVINNIQDKQNTSIHWHGIHQVGSPFADGPSMISQCPLKYRQKQVYEFTVNQTGTYWYHSHVQSQYSEGLWGSLIISNKEEVYSYDDEIVITLSDWYHRPARENEAWYLSNISDGRPYPDSVMINGLGRYPCDIAQLQNRKCRKFWQSRPVFHLRTGKTYRIRVINTSSQASFNFSIDDHLLQTIEMDGIDIAPQIPAQLVVPIAPAQRYSFLISNNEVGGNKRFLIRATAHDISQTDNNINKFQHALLPELTAVLSYRDENPTRVSAKTETFDYSQKILPEKLSDRLDSRLNEFDLLPYDESSPPTFDPLVDREFILNSDLSPVDLGGDRGIVTRFTFNETTFQLPEHKPLLHSVVDGEPLPSSILALEFEHMKVVQIVVNSRVGTHPLHLHGHTFWVMAMGAVDEGPYDPTRHSLVTKAPLRDTVVVQSNSFVIIRFRADNPGVWPFHCHIDWHNLGGMALVLNEAPEVSRTSLQIPSQSLRICTDHQQV